MPVIHFLNVKEGDCSIIQHISERTTLIDVSNAKVVADNLEAALTTFVSEAARKGTLGNFNQKKHPENPIAYLKDQGISQIFRFILTHPDMDHMDGIKGLFEEYQPLNFWDTDNNEEKEFEIGSPYDEQDWLYYRGIRNSKPETSPKRLTLYSGSKGEYYNLDESGNPGADGLQVLAPTPTLVGEANETGNYNDCSYVILYRTGQRKIVFGGDSHDKSWEYILRAHGNDVANVDLLIAPHHGRSSGRSYEFLDILKPKVTFFGNARSEHLAYDAWNRRSLWFVTNNQAGCMLMEINGSTMDFYVTHKPFAEKFNPNAYYNGNLHAYFCFSI